MKVNNIDELLVALIGLTAEIPKDIKIDGIADRTITAAVSRGKTQGILNPDKKYNRIRLKSPKGLEMLKAIDENLYDHYMIISHNHSFPETEKGKLRMVSRRDCYLFMIEADAHIDNMIIDYESNKFGRAKTETEESRFDKLLGGSNLLSQGVKSFNANEFLEDAISLIPKGDRWFYTSNIIKRSYNQGGKKSMVNSSRLAGMYFADNNSYVVYYIRETDSQMMHTAEKEAIHISFRLHKAAFGSDSARNKYSMHKKGQAICIVEDDDIAEAIITEKNKKKFSPTSDFESVHIIPDSENGKEVLRILSVDGWEDKVIKTIYGKTVEYSCDGVYHDLPSYEFISCNYSKIARIKKADGRKVHIVCYAWQKELISRLLQGYGITYTILEGENLEKFRRLLYKK